MPRKRPARIVNSSPVREETEASWWPEEELEVFAPPTKSKSLKKKVQAKSIGMETDDILYMNKKKLEIIEEWFISQSQRSCSGKQILLISGPTGSGKSHTVFQLAKRYNILLKDFFKDQEPTANSLSNSKYKSLQFESTESVLPTEILLLDNFCTTLLKPGLLMTISTLSKPVIVIVTEPVILEPSLLVWMRDLLSNASLLHVETLPYPRTSLEKAVADQFSFQSDEIIANCGGDMRSVLTMHMLAGLCEDGEIDSSSLICDRTINLFHLIGKVIYPRKCEEVYDIASIWPDDPELFNLYLHYNCPLAVKTTAYLDEVLSSFSTADAIFSTRGLHDHWKHEYAAIPSRSISYLVTKHLEAGKTKISMTKPAYFGSKMDRKFRYFDI